MPELPEVETIKLGLEKTVRGKTVREVIIHEPSLIKEPGIKAFREKITGQKIKNIIRQGKLLILELTEADFLVIHLRIAGWLVYGDLEPKVRVAFRLSDGGEYLNYMDQRLLGELRLVKDYRELKFLKTLGPEPFALTPETFAKILEKRKTRIKTLLLDQKMISGIGNIYAQEALFLAGIDPRRRAEGLSAAEAKNLLEKIVCVLKEGIKYGGSSVDNYRNVNGQKGGMEKRLKVYGRDKQLCYLCKKPLTKIALAGRGTCFCSHCQK